MNKFSPNAVVSINEHEFYSSLKLPANAIVLGLRTSKNLPAMTQTFRDFRDSNVAKKKRSNFRTLCFDFYVPFFGKYYHDYQTDIKDGDFPFFVQVKETELPFVVQMDKVDKTNKWYRKLTGQDMDTRIAIDLESSKFKHGTAKNNQEQIDVSMQNNIDHENDNDIANNHDDDDAQTQYTSMDLLSFARMAALASDMDMGSSLGDPTHDGGLVQNESIHELCKTGNLADVVRCVSNDKSTMESVNPLDPLGQTPLMVAIQHGHSEIVKLLIDHKVNFGVCDKAQQTIIHYACKYGNFEALEQLNYADVVHFNSKTKSDTTVFHYACLGGHENIVDHLLTMEGIDVVSTNKAGIHAVHFACLSGNVNIVDKLLSIPKLGCNVTTSDKSRKNVFHYACMSGFLDIVEYLCTNHALNVYDGDKDGKICLHHAAERGYIDVVRYLVETVHISIESHDLHINTALHLAIAGQYEKPDIASDDEKGDANSEANILELVKYLIEVVGADFMATNAFHWNVLHFASRYGRKDVVEYLLTIPSICNNIEAIDEYGWTALHHAIISGDFNVAKCLLSQGRADVGATNRDKWTALHYACRNGYLEVVKSLIAEYNADMTLLNKFGQTPRDVAKERNQQEIDRYLELLESGESSIN